MGPGLRILERRWSTVWALKGRGGMPGRVRKEEGPGSLSKEEAGALEEQRGCVTEGGWAFGGTRAETGVSGRAAAGTERGGAWK